MLSIIANSTYLESLNKTVLSLVLIHGSNYSILYPYNIISFFLLFLSLPEFIGRGTCICESNTCECDRAPLSGYNYFGQGTTSSDGIDEGCECDPDDCYNTNYPMVSMIVCMWHQLSRRND